MILRPALLALLIALAAPLTLATAGPGAPQVENLSVDDVTVIEGDGGTATATFTVTLSGISPDTVTVDYASADGTAVAPGDYSATSGTLTFLSGETTRAVTVDLNGEALDEEDETYTVELSNATNATIGDGTGLGTITDDDPLPALSVNDVTVTEGNGGTVDATFAVGLDNPSGRTVTVDFATANGTAAAPADYAATSGTLTFAAGQTTKQVTVQVNGDLLDEIDENFMLNLSGAGNATISDGAGVGAITDDDPLVGISVDDVSVLEGNFGLVSASFTVSLSSASGRSVSIDYATANGSAIAPVDYLAATGTLNFAAGETTKQVTVFINGDLLDEANETYFLNLSNAANATIADGQGLGTITNDDGPPSLSVNDVTVTEGDSGTTSATFTVTLAPASGQNVSVDYSTADGTATAPADYAATSGTLTFAPGQTTQTVTVSVAGDTVDELDETFTVNLSNAVNAAIADGTGLGTILDDDSLPALSINDVTVTEPDAGTTSATFTVSLNAASAHVVTVDYADGGRHRDCPGGLRRRLRQHQLRCRRDDEAGDRARQRRPARRGERDLLRQPHEPDERDDRRRTGPGHDHGQRPAAVALDQRRHGRRGQHRHGLGDLHGDPQHSERPTGHGRLCDCERDGGGACRLPGRQRHAHVHSRPDDQAGDRARQRRPAR